MSKIVYFQCPTGISGDMCLGALVNLGVSLEYLVENLNKLGIEQEYKLWAEFVTRKSQQAVMVHVDLIKNHHHHHQRHLPEIEQIIQTADLPPRVEAWSLAIFRQLAVAEGAVHGISPEKVHFHEVGAVDAIVDVVGTCLGLDWLGIDSNSEGLPLLYCSKLPTGGGTVGAAHGIMAVPVPAVLKLWEMRKCPVYSNGIEKELVTPTGAAIVTTLATEFGSPPDMNLEKVGMGAGNKNFKIPNILRIWLGETAESENSKKDKNKGIKHKITHEETKHNSELVNQQHQDSTSPYLENISVLETQIDDISPQAIGYIFEELFAVGAVDVFTQAVGMKKNRPGVLLTVICHSEQLTECETILFRETTTLGIRRFSQQRSVLQREIQQLETEYGKVRVKVAWIGTLQNKSITNVHPEYADCAELARKYNIPWQEIHRLALQTWYSKN
ncbi:nickel pincer cofactor biosynthesis protein LarC [Rivularia sp. PCC 7116]|uniref:nickel pincer cofactor biosynthesis protein LarC n=1 Tax=Rivularia sp. PCC 7116 TaxID=373994 RepID=UPI0005C7DE66|nr:nickel pincer cofactor biosynthesis protein LarC [Rivularia sp. PCC 7116]